MTIKPYGPRVVVSDMPGEQKKTEDIPTITVVDMVTGKLHEMEPKEQQDHMARGMVAHVGDDVPLLFQGMIVYYPRPYAVELRDGFHVINANAILAFEEG